MLNNLPRPFLIFSQSDYSIQIVDINSHNGKQSRSRSVGFFRNQLIWIYTICKGRTCLGSAEIGLNIGTDSPVPLTGKSLIQVCTFCHLASIFLEVKQTYSVFCTSTIRSCSDQIFWVKTIQDLSPDRTARLILHILFLEISKSVTLILT